MIPGFPPVQGLPCWFLSSRSAQHGRHPELNPRKLCLSFLEVLSLLAMRQGTVRTQQAAGLSVVLRGCGWLERFPGRDLSMGHSHLFCHLRAIKEGADTCSQENMQTLPGEAPGPISQYLLCVTTFSHRQRLGTDWVWLTLLSGERN